LILETVEKRIFNMVAPQKARAFHTGSDQHGRQLSAKEREHMLRPYLPKTPQSRPSQRKQRLRPAIRHMIHLCIYSIVHAFFSVYVRLRGAYQAVIGQVSEAFSENPPMSSALRL
jgi:dehydrodolichyl diphosphate syntase complex subunit NUS1